MNYWLVKSEPVKYSWQQFLKDGKTVWDGVRNYTARNNLRAMKLGDFVLYYHSNEGKEIVGYAKVVREAFQDPTTEDPAWVSVEISPEKTFKNTVTLEHIKTDAVLENMLIIKQGRLSVMPVTKKEFEHILKLGK